MKTKVEIYDISHDDLVNLFSTALYGSSYFECNYHVDDNDETVEYKPTDCYEDKIARCLLAGKRVEMRDHFAEDDDEHYGTLTHRWNKDYCCMCYDLTLDDIKRGVEKMLGDGEWHNKYAQMWINDDNAFDMCVADAIMQCVIFGEEIYG